MLITYDNDNGISICIKQLLTFWTLRIVLFLNEERGQQVMSKKSTNVLICHRHKLLYLIIITVIIVIVAVPVLNHQLHDHSLCFNDFSIMKQTLF
jgi:hypothetical protein